MRCAVMDMRHGMEYEWTTAGMGAAKREMRRNAKQIRDLFPSNEPCMRAHIVYDLYHISHFGNKIHP